jgi:CRISP-associated protein Cas1
MDEGVRLLGAAPDVVPELVPARMLNEYAYCPRLFFLEWVDRLWAPSSGFTVCEG